MSKSDYPNLKLYQVSNSAVGMVDGSAAAEEFFSWFPEKNNALFFDTENGALDALENGGIDLFMALDQMLLAQTNYRENPGYKINISFPADVESFLGFHKNERVLCSIMDKAQAFLNIDNIIKNWTSRVFDSSRQIVETRSLFFAVIAGILSLTLTGTAAAFVIFLRKNKIISRQSALLTALYTSSPDFIISTDMNGTYTSCNNSYLKYYGLQESDVIGKKAGDFLQGRNELLKIYHDTDRAIMSGDSVAKAESWVISPDGSRVLYELVKFPIMENGKITGIIGLSRDITAHRDAEEAALEASKSKSNFLARMSHEIRTPMNAIIGLTEIALREKSLDAVLKYAVTVKQAGQNLLAIINDILDFSKIEQGRLEIIPEAYSLSSLINDVVSIIRMRVVDSRLRFTVKIDSKLPNALVGDEVRLRQVILNLLSNAIKYTDAGFVSLTVSGEVEGGDRLNLVMEVTDSGRGIKPEDTAHIFEAYAQSDRRKNKHIEGTGLGLTISGNIIEAMGGSISVRSEYGKGSTFTVRVPQRIRELEKVASVNNPGEKNVLVFERREIYTDSIAYALDNLGVPYKVTADEAGLLAELSSGEYGFLFIALTLYEQHKTAIINSGTKARIVLITKFGEAISDSRLNVLSRPAHCISVANVINGDIAGFTYGGNNTYITRFTAPDAKILIVDDINTNLKVAEGLLLPYTAQIDLCKSGFEAIGAVKNKRYDLIMMDDKMPEMDGTETTRRIRDMGDEDAYFENVPIIALTANAVSGMRERFLANGFDDYLSKPIDTARLNAVLEKWIPKKLQKNAVEILTADERDDSSSVFIEGIDTEQGISHTGGTMERFRAMLAVFLSDGAAKLSEIKSSLDAGDLPLYTVYVHGLKSALASIGANRLQDAALSLELAGRRGDWEMIGKHTPALLTELESLLNRIRGALGTGRNNGTDGKAMDSAAAVAELTELKDAIAGMDAAGMNRTVKNLRRLASDSASAAAVNAIHEKILLADYDEAVLLTEQMINNNS